MKVCASIAYGPFNIHVERFDSITAAVDYFRREVAGTDFGTGTDEQCIDLYPQCPDCQRDMVFHDYPLARYSVGPRGGVMRDHI